MKNSTFLMLLGTLAVVDFLCLLMLIIDVALMQAWIADIHSAFYNYLQFYMLNAFKSIIFTYETYLIIAISMERYLAACWYEKMRIFYFFYLWRFSSFIQANSLSADGTKIEALSTKSLTLCIPCIDTQHIDKHSEIIRTKTNWFCICWWRNEWNSSFCWSNSNSLETESSLHHILSSLDKVKRAITCRFRHYHKEIQPWTDLEWTWHTINPTPLLLLNWHLPSLYYQCKILTLTKIFEFYFRIKKFHRRKVNRNYDK